MVEIAASILSVSEQNATKVFYGLEVAKVDYFHIDVMDGKFVSNNTLERMKDFTNTLKQISNIPLDIHLMVEDVEEKVEEYSGFEPNCITFHLEALSNKEEVLNSIKKIKESGSKVGISIKPKTSIEEIYEYLPMIHRVLIMTVEPGLGGQTLIPEIISKIKNLHQYIQKNNYEVDIEIDGGINASNVEELQEAGGNILVIGTALVNSQNYEESVRKMRFTEE